MMPPDRLTAAIDTLERLVEDTVRTGVISRETEFTALRMIRPALQILRTDARLFENATPEQEERTLAAFQSAGDEALADAILGGTK